MSDYGKLVEALRDECDWTDVSDCIAYELLMHDAADAIEALQTEVYKANKNAEAYRTMYFTKHGEITIEKVRELDEIDCHFHSALIRIMYKRIEELEAEVKRLEPKRGDIVRCCECKNGRQGNGIPSGRVLCAKPFMGDTVAGAMHDADWYCGDGAKMEVQDANS